MPVRAAATAMYSVSRVPAAYAGVRAHEVLPAPSIAPVAMAMTSWPDVMAYAGRFARPLGNERLAQHRGFGRTTHTQLARGTANNGFAVPSFIPDLQRVCSVDRVA